MRKLLFMAILASFITSGAYAALIGDVPDPLDPNGVAVPALTVVRERDGAIFFGMYNPIQAWLQIS